MLYITEPLSNCLNNDDFYDINERVDDELFCDGKDRIDLVNNFSSTEQLAPHSKQPTAALDIQEIEDLQYQPLLKGKILFVL